MFSLEFLRCEYFSWWLSSVRFTSIFFQSVSDDCKWSIGEMAEASGGSGLEVAGAEAGDASFDAHVPITNKWDGATEERSGKEGNGEGNEKTSSDEAGSADGEKSTVPNNRENRDNMPVNDTEKAGTDRSQEVTNETQKVEDTQQDGGNGEQEANAIRHQGVAGKSQHGPGGNEEEHNGQQGAIISVGKASSVHNEAMNDGVSI